MKADAEAGGPSSQGSTEPWDMTFNRETNDYKGRDKSLLPTSPGRVSGFGMSMKFINYYHSDAETKKERRRPSKDKAEVVELRKKVETLESQIVDSATVERLVDEKLKSFLPPGFDGGSCYLECGWSTGADIRAQPQRQQLHHEPKRVAGPDDPTAQTQRRPLPRKIPSRSRRRLCFIMQPSGRRMIGRPTAPAPLSRHLPSSTPSPR